MEDSFIVEDMIPVRNKMKNLGGPCNGHIHVYEFLSTRINDLEMDMYILLSLHWITNKDLLYSTGNSAQCYVAA